MFSLLPFYVIINNLEPFHLAIVLTIYPSSQFAGRYFNSKPLNGVTQLDIYNIDPWLGLDMFQEPINFNVFTRLDDLHLFE